MSHARQRFLCLLAMVLALTACSGGDYPDALRSLLEQERLVGQARYQLLLAADATKNAVLATDEETAKEFVRTARSSLAQVKEDLDKLGGLFARSRQAESAKALARVTTDLASLEKVAGSILGLAGRNTNLQASLLSHTAANQAVERLRTALASAGDGADCPAAREALRAVAACLTILSLEDRHIDEASDDGMDRLERQMEDQRALAAGALDRLAGLLPAGATGPEQARAALGDLWQNNQRIVALSRENSNIAALTLTMGHARQLLAQTLLDVDALRKSVLSREFSATR